MVDTEPTIEDRRKVAWNDIQYNRDEALSYLVYELSDELSIDGELSTKFIGKVLSYPYRANSRETVYEERFNLGGLVHYVHKSGNRSMLSDICRILEKSSKTVGIHGDYVTRFRNLGQYLADNNIDLGTISHGIIRDEDILDSDLDTPVYILSNEEEA